MRLILDMKADRLEEGLGVALQFMREFPGRKMGKHHGVVFTNRDSKNVYYAYKSKTGVVIWQDGLAKDRK